MPGRLGSRRGLPIAVALFGLGLAGGAGTTAFAQGTPDSRVAVSIGAAVPVSTTSFSQAVTFEQYAETGSLTAAYTSTHRPVVDVGATVRLRGAFGVGVSGSYSTGSGTAQVSASVPNPLVFGQPRQVDGPAGVAHTELGIHIQAVYWVQPTPRLEIELSGGPSVFRVDQDFVSDVMYAQTYPYTTATYQSASVTRERQTATGANIGGEIGWRVAPHLSLAAAVRYSHAAADFPDTSASAVGIGGVHVGAGVRLLF